MTETNIGKASLWSGVAFIGWLFVVMVIALASCTPKAHVRAVNTAAVTLETTAYALLSEYDAGRPSGDEERRAYAERWEPVIQSLSAAYAAHDAWRILVERNADSVAIIAAAARAREALCELQRVAKGVAMLDALCIKKAPPPVKREGPLRGARALREYPGTSLTQEQRAGDRIFSSGVAA